MITFFSFNFINLPIVFPLSLSLQLDQYKKQRIIDFQKALVLYAEAKVKTARDAYALLAKDLSSIKTMELDGS